MERLHELPKPPGAVTLNLEQLTNDWFNPDSFIHSPVRDHITEALVTQLRSLGVAVGEYNPTAPSGTWIRDRKLILGEARDIISGVLEHGAYGDSDLEKAAEMARLGKPISTRIFLEGDWEDKDAVTPIMATAHIVAALKSGAIVSDMHSFGVRTETDFYAAEDHLTAGLVLLAQAVDTGRKIAKQVSSRTVPVR